MRYLDHKLVGALALSTLLAACGGGGGGGSTPAAAPTGGTDNTGGATGGLITPGVQRVEPVEELTWGLAAVARRSHWVQSTPLAVFS